MIQHVLRVILFAIVTASVLAGPVLGNTRQGSPLAARSGSLSVDAVSGQSRAGPVG